MPSWIGAYSLVVLVADTVLAARDPWGFRPLSVGRLPDGGHAVASETCALRTLGCIDIEEVRPGEIVVMSGADIRRLQAVPAATTLSRCTFEFIYFSRPDSEWDSMNVHQVRQRLGERLAAEHPADADVVVPVPDSSIPAAIGYSRVSGIPYNDGLIKNRYIGRTFIEPTQEMRSRRVAMKFNSLPENLAGLAWCSSTTRSCAAPRPARSSLCCAKQARAKCTCASRVRRSSRRATSESTWVTTTTSSLRA